MTVKQLFIASVAAAALFSLLAAPSPGAIPRSTTDNPDFTQGGSISIILQKDR